MSVKISPSCQQNEESNLINNNFVLKIIETMQTPDRSRQMEMTNSRRLDALRTNGNNILGGKNNDLDAASSFAKHQRNDPRQSPDQASRGGQYASEMKIDKNDYDQHQFDAVDPASQLHLVPCRWERSGWRYVQKDPQDHGFFKNPNRVNNFGVAPAK